MPIFKYTAKKGPDKLIESTIQAHNEEEVIELLSQSGLFPVKIEEVSQKVSTSSLGFSGKISRKNIINFSRQLSSLLKSGVPILKSLNIISQESENLNFKSIIDNIQVKVKEGERLSSALKEYPNVFSPLYIAMVQSGEINGTLEESLLRIAEHLKKQDEFVTKLRTALTYPFFMASMGILTVIFMITFVLPKLTKVFFDLHQELPLPTKIVLGISSILRHFWFIVIFLIILIIFFFKKETEGKKLVISRIKLNLPILKNFILKTELARLCRTLEVLIKTGIPILQGIESAVEVLDNEIIKQKIRECKKEMEEGVTFGQTLKKIDFIPPFVTNLVIVGEESGRLSESLSEIADFYERDTEEFLRITGTILEPLMILAVGVVIGFIVISMLLPIFQINLMAK